MFPVWLDKYIEVPVTALCSSLVRSEGVIQGPGQEVAIAQASKLALGQLHAFAPLLRGAFVGLIVAFDLLVVLQTGKRLHRHDPKRRTRLIQTWKLSPLRVQRDFIRFFESFVLLSLYSTPGAVSD